MSRHGGPLSDSGHFRRALRRSRQHSAGCSSLESEQLELSNLRNPSHDLTHRKSSKVVNQGPPSFSSPSTTSKPIASALLLAQHFNGKCAEFGETNLWRES